MVTLELLNSVFDLEIGENTKRHKIFTSDRGLEDPDDYDSWSPSLVGILTDPMHPCVVFGLRVQMAGMATLAALKKAHLITPSPKW